MRLSTAVTVFLATLLVSTPLTSSYPFRGPGYNEEKDPVMDGYLDRYVADPDNWPQESEQAHREPVKQDYLDRYVADPDNWPQESEQAHWEPVKQDYLDRYVADSDNWPQESEQAHWEPIKQGYGPVDWDKDEEEEAMADWQALKPRPVHVAQAGETDEDETKSDSGEDSETDLNKLPTVPPTNQTINDADDENGGDVAVMEHNEWEAYDERWTEEQDLDYFLGGIPNLQTHIPLGACLDTLYIIAFTADLPYARSVRYHEVNVKVNHTTRVIPLPAQPSDYIPLKGDMWKLYFHDTGDHYGLGFEGCVERRHLRSIGIEEGSDDGWWIESILTLVCSDGMCMLLSIDLHVNRWIDGNSGPEARCFMLNTII